MGRLMAGEATTKCGPTTSEQKSIRHPPLLQSQHPIKTDEIEVIETTVGGDERPQDAKRSIVGWVCCAPCIWIRTSGTVHKFAITTATLLVTSLLVASPILFLISTAPSQLPKDCYPQEDADCQPTKAPPPECAEIECKLAANSIQSKINWKIDRCKFFKDYSCSPIESSLRAVKSAQEGVDLQMQQLLAHNTTSGPFRKLGRLYGSCLRQSVNSSTIHLVLDKLGGYLPIGALGPSSISTLITKINQLGPTPLVGIYYELSYGKKPQTLLIIDGPIMSAPVLEHPIRWMGPKAPPFRIKEGMPKLLNQLLDNFLPAGLGPDQEASERNGITTFISELLRIQRDFIRRDFLDSYVTYNVTTLTSSHPFLNWTNLIPANWSGAIVVRSPEYLQQLQQLLGRHPNRVIHNSILLVFALGILPPGQPNAEVCTKATVWAMPEVASALFIAQYSEETIRGVITRTNETFQALKAYLKRAPSLKGAALVKLSQLEIQARPWPSLSNMTRINEILNNIEVSSDNWFENVLKLYKMQNLVPDKTLNEGVYFAWAYPTIAKIFYDTLSHSIVVPLSVILVPYFNEKLPPYLHYASVGVSIAKEILRSITKQFDEKAMKCVPSSVNVFSNNSRMDILIHSGGMQIAYHSMLTLTGSVKSMERLPGLDLSPTQIFFLVSAQELCADSIYNGVNTNAEDFSDILGWLIAQGGSATDVFQCPSGTMLYLQKTCNVL